MPNTTRFAALALLLATTILYAETAGAPLKGVDVKLGKNPGGSAAARTLTTDDRGTIDLGTLERGSYFLLFEDEVQPSDPVVVDVKITGALTSQPTTFRYNRKSASIVLRNGVRITERTADRKTSEPERMIFESDGTSAMKVQIVKSKSNITNN